MAIKWGNKNSQKGQYKDEATQKVIDYIKSRPKQEVPDIDLGETVVKTVAETFQHMIATSPMKGIEDNENEDLKNILDRSEFYRLFPRVEKYLSLNGSHAIAALMIMNEEYIVDLFPSGIETKIGKRFIEFVGRTSNIFVQSKSKYYHSYRWYYKDGIAYVQAVGISVDEKSNSDYVELIEGGFDRPIDARFKNVIPVNLLTNTDEAESDLVRAEGIYKSLNFYSNALKDEFEFSKTLFNFNNNFGGTTTGEEIERIIKNGGRSIPNSSANGKTELPIGPAQLAGGGLTFALLMVDTLEDKLQKYMFAIRDSLATGTNKHNTEVATFNQLAAETVLYKIERIRNNQWTDFFDTHIKKLLSNFSGKLEAKLAPSLVEKYKVESMKPQVQRPTKNTKNTKEKTTKENE